MPTILIIGDPDAQSMAHGRQIGAAAVLYKPIEEEALFDAIEAALATPKA